LKGSPDRLTFNIYFPLEVGRLLDPADVESNVPDHTASWRRKLNARVTRAEQVIEPDRAGAAAGRHLDIDPQSPVRSARHPRVLHAFDRPIERRAHAAITAERYRYSIDFHSGSRRHSDGTMI